jgi:hypothetical protein
MTRRGLGFVLYLVLVVAGAALMPVVTAQEYFRSASRFLNQMLAPDGTSALPAYSFASEPTAGFWRESAGVVRLQGAFKSTSWIESPNSGYIAWSTRMLMRSPANGVLNLANYAETVGSQLKVDALPTVSSAFGTSPSVTAGSTPFAGSVNVGTGGVATSGVINFNGTAFPSTPFCTASAQTNYSTMRVIPSTTQLTLIAQVAWSASEIVSWHCISAK